MTAAIKLYRVAQVRELDRIAIDEEGIAGYELMTRAGKFTFQSLRDHYPHVRSVQLYCGAGNNAGDAYVVARLALQAGMKVQVLSLCGLKQLKGDALTAYQDFCHAGGRLECFPDHPEFAADVIVDGIFGTGLGRAVSGLYANAISAINGSQLPVIALDIPSGLNADTGKVMGCAVKATLSCTFIARKQGLYTGDSAEYCGKVLFDDLAVPDVVYAKVPDAAYLMQQSRLPARSACAHKGSNGHVLVIGGECGYSGAVRMAAQAAARVGAGLLSVATRSAHANMINMTCPELMCHGVENESQLQALVSKASVIIIGPGLGQSDWAKGLLKQVLASDKAVLIDADGLNLLAGQALTIPHGVLTPHPGEAARLLGQTIHSIEQDRFAAVSALQEKYQAVVVLKGAGSLVSDGQTISVCPTGNAGMASGGFGDVLSGIIGGLMAQGLAQAEATRMGVYLHGEAADMAARDGQRGMLASDLMPYIRQLVNRI